VPTDLAAVTAVAASVNPSRGPCSGPFIFSGAITTNGAGTVTYRWVRDDGTRDPMPPAAPHSLTFATAGTLVTASHFWSSVAPAGDRSARIEVLSPDHLVSPPARFTCP
jgi:hypothetical protein